MKRFRFLTVVLAGDLVAGLIAEEVLRQGYDLLHNFVPSIRRTVKRIQTRRRGKVLP